MRILAVAFCPPSGAIADNFVQISTDLLRLANVSLLCPENLPFAGGKFQHRYLIPYSKRTPFTLMSHRSIGMLHEIVAQRFDTILFFSQHILNVPVSSATRSSRQVMWWHEPAKRGQTTLVKQTLYELHDHIMTRRAESIILACESMRSLVPPQLSDKIRIVSLPFLERFDADVDSGTTSEAEKSDILFFGNIESYKGLDVLAEALQSLYDENFVVRTLLIGQGNMRKHCPKLLELNAQYPKHVRILNSYQPYSTICAAVNDCQAVVLPYLTSTGTNTLPIAYRYRKPVISTHTGCFADNVIEGKTGLRVQPGDAKALALAIKVLISDQDMIKRMGECAYAYYIEHFVQQRVTNELFTVFAG